MDRSVTDFLQPTPIVDAGHPAVLEFTRSKRGASASHRDQAVALYYAVRDGFRYDPYALDLTDRGLSASEVLVRGHGWCVTKAVLLAAACRASGIPAKLGFADVRNHLSTERMRQRMNTDVFYFHGYTAIYLEGQWLKATPAFNIELCERFRLKPLEFDGRQDSIYHPFDLAGNKHMEYLNFRGEFLDVPVEEMRGTFTKYYSALTKGPVGDFDADVARETAASV